MDTDRKELLFCFFFLKKSKPGTLNRTFQAATMYTLKADCNLVLLGRKRGGQRSRLEPPSTAAWWGKN